MFYVMCSLAAMPCFWEKGGPTNCVQLAHTQYMCYSYTRTSIVRVYNMDDITTDIT